MKQGTPHLRGIVIPESELQLSFARSGGPGGQNGNKVETKVTITFDYMASHALSWEQKGRIARHAKVQSCLNADGMIAITSQRHRSQLLNREDAIEKLHELLHEVTRPRKRRIPTKKTKSSERKRVDNKRSRSTTKTKRQKVRSDDD